MINYKIIHYLKNNFEAIPTPRSDPKFCFPSLHHPKLTPLTEFFLQTIKIIK